MIDNELIVGAVHDLRVPLNGIKGHIHFLKNNAEDSKVIAELDIIEKSCQDMEKLINTILDYSKLSEGAYSLNLQKFDVRKMIKDVSNQATASGAMKGVRLMTEVSEKVPKYLICDEFRLALLIGNLVSNSLKYTSVGCIGIYVDCDRLDDYVMLEMTVADTGSGIETERAATVFDAYSQVSDGASKVGGTGLGLYVIRQFALLMNGDVELDNRPGEGCIFTLKVRAKLCEDELDAGETINTRSKVAFLAEIYDIAASQKRFGSDENKEAMKLAIERLRNSLDVMDAMEAEYNVIPIKTLLGGSGDETRKLGLKLAMAVRGGDEAMASSIIKLIEEEYEKS